MPPIDLRRLLTTETSSLVSTGFIRWILLATLRTAPRPRRRPRPRGSPSPGRRPAIRLIFLRSASAAWLPARLGPSATRTTPGRPVARKTMAARRHVARLGRPRRRPAAARSTSHGAARSGPRRQRRAGPRWTCMPRAWPGCSAPPSGKGGQREAEDQEVRPSASTSTPMATIDDERAEGGQRHPPADHRVDAARGDEDLTDLGETAGLLGRGRLERVSCGTWRIRTTFRRRSRAAAPNQRRRLLAGRAGSGRRRDGTAARAPGGPSASSPWPTAGPRGRTSAPAARP